MSQTINSSSFLIYLAGFASASILFFARKVYKDGLLSSIITISRSVPGVQSIISAEQKKLGSEIGSMIRSEFKFLTIDYEELPKEGLSKDEIFRKFDTLLKHHHSFNEGKAFGGIYHEDEELHDIATQAHVKFASTNALFPSIFPALKKFENEVVRMTRHILHGDERVVGVMTTGGTESILMSIKAYRDKAKKERGITQPEMIVPVTAHPAFCKGAHYFGVKFVIIPVDPQTYEADVKAIKDAVNRNTIMIVASAPSYPQGVIDPIEEIASLAKKRNIPLHVDACLGAYILPWLHHLTKKWDFAVPGVTSISADLHKYGGGPKGTSLILYRDSSYRRYQHFTTGYWAGGLYCSPSMTGSRAGGVIASAWATMVARGEKGYMLAAKEIHKHFVKLCVGISSIPNLKLMGKPEACCIAFIAQGIDTFKIADAMEARGWKNLNRLRQGVQIQVGHKNSFDIDKWLQDLSECTTELKNNPDKYKGMAAIYGMASKIPADAGIIEPILEDYLEALYE
eukprot:TRINITY_DN9095_c0_g1_i1.p1 TRINITY_DN9095_c0_g1~~TRINITY_DN9095_c0_g1_i1.p1  ORF type:complete len:531 (+),score=82.86 TRINITY_DN9095_c0_g1_i1:59-1594(+)